MASSSALADQRAARSPLPLAVCPPTQLACAPTGEPVAPQIPGKRRQEGAQGSSGGTHLRAASPAVADPGGARARPFTRRRTTVLGSRALRPPVPKLLNLRAAHALRGQRPTRRIGPLGGSVRPRSPQCPARRSTPRSPPQLVLSPSRLRSAAAPSRERGQSSARTREGIPPLCRPTPEPAPLPGIRRKKRTGAPGPGVRSPLPHALARSWGAGLAAARARSEPWRRPSALAPPCTPARLPGDSTLQSRGCSSRHPGGRTGPRSLWKPQFPYQDPGK